MIPASLPAALLDMMRRDVPLADHTTIRLGGPMRFLAEPADEGELSALLAALSAAGLPHRVLGGGSNLLGPDGPIDDVVIHPSHFLRFEAQGGIVLAGAGVSLPAFVARVNSLGLRGAQVLAGIPGQLGGAVAMNAGGRYGEIGDIVECVRVVEGDGRPRTLGRDELGFGYRSSRLPKGSVVTEVSVRLEPTSEVAALKKESGRILKEKNAAQPTTGWNFGCMFKNPREDSAGKILDRLGLRGRTLGQARISPLHANFVENLGGARAADVLALLRLCEDTAKGAGLLLEREVRIWAES